MGKLLMVAQYDADVVMADCETKADIDLLISKAQSGTVEELEFDGLPMEDCLHDSEEHNQMIRDFTNYASNYLGNDTYGFISCSDLGIAFNFKSFITMFGLTPQPKIGDIEIATGTYNGKKVLASQLLIDANHSLDLVIHLFIQA